MITLRHLVFLKTYRHCCSPNFAITNEHSESVSLERVTPRKYIYSGLLTIARDKYWLVLLGLIFTLFSTTNLLMDKVTNVEQGLGWCK